MRRTQTLPLLNHHFPQEMAIAVSGRMYCIPHLQTQPYEEQHQGLMVFQSSICLQNRETFKLVFTQVILMVSLPCLAHTIPRVTCYLGGASHRKW